MIGYSPLHLFFAFVVFFAAGIVKGVTGMGLPTVAMGLLGIVMTPVHAVVFQIVPNYVTNFWQLFTGPDIRGLWRRLWTMMLALILGTALGIGALTHGEGKWTAFGLGVVLMIYAGLGLFHYHAPPPGRHEKWLSPVMGGLTGLIGGGTGSCIIPAVPYLNSLNLEKEELVQALGLTFTVSNIVMTLGLACGGALRLHGLGLSALMVLPALLGMWVGQKIRYRVSPETFRRWFLICLFLLGLQLAAKPLFS
ncbi:hypothetical protein SAMN05444156_1902 [Verrucomicrobium sp. GAS474]|uniref:sulfite exporter TauE/SafE family protein n=1 Tax=Verrucomicrobium sp. GAS474 TaxID=1882831 RepID=UPI00087CD761|nr:sulfite exporter TauE/SafE family protein [Verrucomicrobium sp. GAS474]SDU09075.1 hypothetical protein SAMN05444156_1902 [Verrucomicrobium sp. GAS474]